MIEHLQLDSEEMSRNERTMREGNLALKAAYDYVRSEVKDRYSRRIFRQELFATMGQNPVVVRGVTLDPHSISLIQAVKDIETSLVKSFSKMVYDRAKYYANRDHGTYLDKGDFVAYGFVGLLEAIYHYIQEITAKDGTKKKVKFITYAYWCICHHIKTAINRKKSNYPWTVQMRRLYERYEKARREFNGPANFQEIADYLGFTEEEQNMLHVALTAFQSERSISKPGNDDFWEDSKGFDYTYLAPQNVHFHQEETLEVDEKEYISELWVSYLEAEILENYISDHHGWKEKLASKYGISRQAPYETLRRLMSRLEAYRIAKEFTAALRAGKKPKVAEFVGPEPEGNREKSALWQKLFNELVEIQANWKAA